MGRGGGGGGYSAVLRSATVLIQAGGGGQCAGAATDDITLTSSASAQRAWSGAGAFNLYDLAVSWMSHATGLTTYSSTNSGNNTNWTFTACGAARRVISIQ